MAKQKIGKEIDMCYNKKGIEPAHLDNEILALPSVQMPREMTTESGCHVTLVFPPESRPGVRRKIAEMFLAAMEKGMRNS